MAGGAAAALQLAAAVVAAAFAAGASSAQPGAAGCTAASTSLMPCLAFLRGLSPTPGTECCTQLGGVAERLPQCLCGVLGGAAGPLTPPAGGSTPVLALLDACKLQRPLLSQCHAPTPAASVEALPSAPTPAAASPGGTALWECTKEAASIGLAPCLNFLLGLSSAPGTACCTQLASAAERQPQCLCRVLGGDAGPLPAGASVNSTRVLALTDACMLRAPPLGHCGGHAPSPFPSAHVQTALAPAGGQPPAGRSNKITPATSVCALVLASTAMFL